jgi:hypothetical protein
VPNRGGSCHPWEWCSLTRKKEVASAFFKQWQDNCPTRPSNPPVAWAAGVGQKFAGKVIKKLLKSGHLPDPELTRPNQKEAGCFVGVGSHALKLEKEVFLLALIQVIDKHPDKTIFNFSDEKEVVNKDALPSKICADPTNGFMDLVPVSGDFHDAFNLFPAVSANPDKPHPVAWTIGQKIGDPRSFVAFVNHSIVSGFVRCNDERCR